MILQNMRTCRNRRRRKKETRRWRGQGAPYLQDVEGGQLHPLPLLRRVHLSPLENNRVRRKVDTPSQRGGRYKHLQRTKRIGGITKRKVTRRNKLPEETLHKNTVHTQPNLPMIYDATAQDAYHEPVPQNQHDDDMMKAREEEHKHGTRDKTGRPSTSIDRIASVSVGDEWQTWHPSPIATPRSLLSLKERP